MLLITGSNRTKKTKYLEENVGSANVVLTEAEIAELRELVNATEVHGSRAPGA